MKEEFLISITVNGTDKIKLLKSQGEFMVQHIDWENAEDHISSKNLK